MKSDGQVETNPLDVVPRFCGYCARGLNMNQDTFLKHVDMCELIRCEEIRKKQGGKHG